MKNESRAEQQSGKQVYNHPVLADLGDLKKLTLGDGPELSGVDVASDGVA